MPSQAAFAGYKQSDNIERKSFGIVPRETKEIQEKPRSLHFKPNDHISVAPNALMANNDVGFGFEGYYRGNHAGKNTESDLCAQKKHDFQHFSQMHAGKGAKSHINNFIAHATSSKPVQLDGYYSKHHAGRITNSNLQNERAQVKVPTRHVGKISSSDLRSEGDCLSHAKGGKMMFEGYYSKNHAGKMVISDFNKERKLDFKQFGQQHQGRVTSADIQSDFVPKTGGSVPINKHAGKSQETHFDQGKVDIGYYNKLHNGKITGGGVSSDFNISKDKAYEDKSYGKRHAGAITRLSAPNSRSDFSSFGPAHSAKITKSNLAPQDSHMMPSSALSMKQGRKHYVSSPMSNPGGTLRRSYPSSIRSTPSQSIAATPPPSAINPTQRGVSFLSNRLTQCSVDPHMRNKQHQKIAPARSHHSNFLFGDDSGGSFDRFNTESRNVF